MKQPLLYKKKKKKHAEININAMADEQPQKKRNYWTQWVNNSYVAFNKIKLYTVSKKKLN